jgi:hypothetical protein
MDHYAYFESMRIRMRTRDKFMDRDESDDKFKNYYVHFKSTGIRPGRLLDDRGTPTSGPSDRGT